LALAGLMGGGIVLIVGSLLPWWHAVAEGGITVNESGIRLGSHLDYKGQIMLAYGILAIISAVIEYMIRFRGRWVFILVGPVAALWTMLDAHAELNTHINVTLARLARQHLPARISIGAGYWVAALGLVVTVIAAFAALANNRARWRRQGLRTTTRALLP
jgi:hypothetical protein